MSRLAQANGNIEFIDLRRTEKPRRQFSSFRFVEETFDGTSSIRRLFSIARSQGAETLVIEEVPAEGAVADEVEEIKERLKGYEMAGLKRLTFWRAEFRSRHAIKTLPADAFVGYALLKRDRVILRRKVQKDGWHVFEALFSQRERPYHYWPAARLAFQFRCAGRVFETQGSLYGQQNGLNKACAQAALRSLCANYLGDPDLTYRRINQLASKGSTTFDPADGLQTRQIRRVLDGLEISYSAINYLAKPELRAAMPYAKALYSGIEGGCGAFLAFGLSGPDAAPKTGHALACHGHTFNEDSWAPHADVNYFKIGEDIRYLPSLSWTGSFVIHDDNMGPNLCLNQSFIRPNNAWLVAVLLPQGYAFPGYLAEAVAANYFYSILPVLYDKNWDNPWIKRLLYYVMNRKLILRTVPVTAEAYLTHLTQAKDWEFARENVSVLKLLNQELKARHLWMVEVSVPEIFATNKRKLGEILIDATQKLSPEISGSSFVMARFPELFVFFDSLDRKGAPVFSPAPSAFKSHLPLLSL